MILKWSRQWLIKGYQFLRTTHINYMVKLYGSYPILYASGRPLTFISSHLTLGAPSWSSFSFANLWMNARDSMIRIVNLCDKPNHYYYRVQTHDHWLRSNLDNADPLNLQAAPWRKGNPWWLSSRFTRGVVVVFPFDSGFRFLRQTISTSGPTRQITQIHPKWGYSRLRYVIVDAS